MPETIESFEVEAIKPIETPETYRVDRRMSSKYIRSLTSEMPELRMSREKLAMIDALAGMRHKTLDLELKRELQAMHKELAKEAYGE